MKSNASRICAIVLLCFFSGTATAQSTTATLSLGSSLNPSVVGQQVTFQAQIAGLAPSGTVQFMDGSANLGAPATVFCVTGPCILSAATLQTSALTPGTHLITATYSGDGQNTPASGTLTQIVLAAAASSIPVLSSWIAAMLALLVGTVGVTSMWRPRR